MGDVTELLKRVRQHDRAALDELVSLMYPDLRRMAHGRLAQNDTITLLDTTSMVHELVPTPLRCWTIDAQSRPQFIVYAAQVLRSVLVDFARKRRAERRGGGTRTSLCPMNSRRVSVVPMKTLNASTTRSTNWRKPTHDSSMSWR